MVCLVYASCGISFGVWVWACVVTPDASLGIGADLHEHPIWHLTLLGTNLVQSMRTNLVPKSMANLGTNLNSVRIVKI